MILITWKKISWYVNSNWVTDQNASFRYSVLTHWGRVMHICVSKLTITGSDNGLTPGQHQAIIWNNAGILLIGPLARNCSEILIEIYKFSLKKMHLKMSSGKWRPSCLSLNVLMISMTKIFIRLPSSHQPLFSCHWTIKDYQLSSGQWLIIDWCTTVKRTNLLVLIAGWLDCL